MLFTTKETEKEFRRIMDEYEDSYTEPLTTEALQEVSLLIHWFENVVRSKDGKNAN